jgi:hypothetical protein
MECHWQTIQVIIISIAKLRTHFPLIIDLIKSAFSVLDPRLVINLYIILKPACAASLQAFPTMPRRLILEQAFAVVHKVRPEHLIVFLKDQNFIQAVS